MRLTTRALGVIPARLGSTRLPRKPLHPLHGRPLIEWVWRRVLQTGVCADVVVATDSDEVAAVARGFGATVELTRPDHPSGTDRVAEVAARQPYRDYGIIVNVQGDEPFVRADHIEAAIALVADGADIGTVASPLAEVGDWHDEDVVKVVRAADGTALLFSRAPIPFVRDRAPTAADFRSGAFLRHVGIYAYRREALERWVSLPECALERLERLEQLRPLAAGLRIAVAVGDAAEAGIDTPADAARAEGRLAHETIHVHGGS